jgi:hypothetical protein
MTKELETAFNHVKKFFPELEIVAFNKYGQWCYMDANFEVFKFGDEIDQGILEIAADSILELPYIFHK